MPTPALDELLIDLDLELQQRGFPPLSDEIIQEVAKALQRPEIPQLLASGQWNAQKLADEVEAALKSQGGGAQATPQAAPPPGAMPQRPPGQAMPMQPGLMR